VCAETQFWGYILSDMVSVPTQLRVGFYIRVSTLDQNPQLQFDELREYCRARGWKIIGEFVDHGLSGKIGTLRPGLRQLLEAVHSHRIDVVLVWRIDRLARSLAELVRLSQEFEAGGINFVSLKNPGLDTTTPQGKLFFGISAVFAEFERDLIIERTRAGLEAAKRRGQKLGRPRTTVKVEEIRKLRGLGLSVRAIAEAVGCSKTTVHDLLRAKSPDARSSDRDD
jgi:DNA invertase Pin-like site-specific DNA recombinase